MFKEIVDAYDKWALCQIQYNFMDIEYQAGTKGLRYAAQKGLPVVVMEPLRGGRLAHKIPKKVAELWQGAGVNRTPADWALQWVWNHPEVSILLSGMSTMQHVKENLASADHSAVGLLTKKDLVHFDKIREEYRRLVPISCTDCRYCLPCPNSVEIADIFEYYNDAIMYDNLRSPRYLYDNLGKEKQACNCVECLECEEKCPQGIPIVEQLKKAHTLLGKQAP